MHLSLILPLSGVQSLPMLIKIFQRVLQQNEQKCYCTKSVEQMNLY